MKIKRLFENSEEHSKEEYVRKTDAFLDFVRHELIDLSDKYDYNLNHISFIEDQNPNNGINIDMDYTTDFIVVTMDLMVKIPESIPEVKKMSDILSYVYNISKKFDNNDITFEYNECNTDGSSLLMLITIKPSKKFIDSL